MDETANTSNKYRAYDTVQKSWRHLKFCEYMSYITARVPRVKLPEGAVRVVQTP